MLATCPTRVRAAPDAGCLCDAPDVDAEQLPPDAEVADTTPPDGPRPVDLFDHFTLTATPTGGSTFEGWTGPCEGTAACTVTLDSAATVETSAIRFLSS